jgi:hypothetical protein
VGAAVANEAAADIGVESALEDLMGAETETLAPNLYLDETGTERAGMMRS